VPLPDAALALLATLELERLPEVLLSAFTEATGAAGAAAWLADGSGELVLRGWRGAMPRQALRGRLDPASGDAGRALAGGAPVEEAGALLVPLLAGGEPLGLVRLDPGAGAPAAVMAAAAALAPAAALAVRNARRVQALERGSLRDRESGAYHLAYLVDQAGREFFKARRYGRSFSLAVVSVDALDALRSAGGHAAAAAAARAVVAAVSRVVRDADVLARASDRDFFALLPETDHHGALVFARRAADELSREEALRAPVPEGAAFSVGAATFPRDGDDFEALRETARTRQQEHRTSLLHRLPSGGHRAGFWETAEALLGDVALADPTSARFRPEPELVEAVHREAARELARDPRARAVLYVAAGGPAAEAPVVRALPELEAAGRAGDTGARLVVLSARGGAPPAHPLATQLLVPGERRLEERPFLLFQSEGAAYALLRGADGRAFHTSDAPLVHALLARLQALYEPQAP
jgi:two-component system, cell cycle response regulator